jgi:hypothetical protein
MNLVWLPITDGEIRNAYMVLVKLLRGRESLKDFMRGWNKTTELHLDEKGTRVLNGLIWCCMRSSVLLTKITKYTNLMKRSPFFNFRDFQLFKKFPVFYGT